MSTPPNTVNTFGGAFIACTRGRSPKRCHCRANAVALCDYPLRGAKKGQTCSAALCAQHCHKINELDLCPAHYRMTSGGEVARG